MYKHKYWRSRACLYCGKEFKHPAHQTERKYCSRQCGSKATYNKRHPNSQGRVWGHEKSVFDAAMEMYWNGSGGAEIARHFNIPVGTVYSWIHDFGGQRKCIEPPRLPKVIRPKKKRPSKSVTQRLGKAKNAEEWLEVFRENTLANNDSFEDLSIYLVCGTLYGQSVNILATVIFESLKDNPLSGKVFAFCNKGGDTITTFAWIDPVFNISKYVKASGTFIWPHENLGKSIEIAKTEFDRLLFLKKHKNSSEKISETLDFMRISCYN